MDISIWGSSFGKWIIGILVAAPTGGLLLFLKLFVDSVEKRMEQINELKAKVLVLEQQNTNVTVSVDKEIRHILERFTDKFENFDRRLTHIEECIIDIKSAVVKEY